MRNTCHCVPRGFLNSLLRYPCAKLWNARIACYVYVHDPQDDNNNSNNNNNHNSCKSKSMILLRVT
eukprot:5288113-Amphidinium_carterae.1